MNYSMAGDRDTVTSTLSRIGGAGQPELFEGPDRAKGRMLQRAVMGTPMADIVEEEEEVLQPAPSAPPLPDDGATGLVPHRYNPASNVSGVQSTAIKWAKTTTLKTSGICFALKIQIARNNEQLSTLLKEVEVLRRFHGEPNIIQIKDAMVEPNT